MEQKEIKLSYKLIIFKIICENLSLLKKTFAKSQPLQKYIFNKVIITFLKYDIVRDAY